MSCDPREPEPRLDPKPPAGPRPGPVAFQCDWRASRPGESWAEIHGEVDLSTSPRMRQTLAIAHRDADVLIIDLRRATFMDSSGAHTITSVAANARQANKAVVVIGGCYQVETMLRLARIGECVPYLTLGRSRDATRT